MPVKRLKTPVFLEDIVAWMCGDSWSFNAVSEAGIDPCVAQLSKFDREVCRNITQNMMPLTQKQVDLCVKMIKRYESQLQAQIGNIAELVDPVALKQPVRVIDQTRAMWFEDDHIIVKFPFNQDVINKMKKYSTNSTIRLGEYMPEEKQWKWLPCEHTYYTLGKILEKHDFEVDQKILELINATLDLEAQHDTLHFQSGKLSSNNHKLNEWMAQQKYLEHALLKVKSNSLKYNADAVKEIGELYRDKWYSKLFSNYHHNQYWLDANKIKKHQLIDFVLDYKLGPVVIKFGSTSHKKELLKIWIYAFQQHDTLKNKQVSFIYNEFDSWSNAEETHKMLDAHTDAKEMKDPFVKNSVGADTKFVVMPYRPKKEWLISKARPMLTIQLGMPYGQDWHERYMLENTHTLVYYSSDGPNTQDIVTVV